MSFICDLLLIASTTKILFHFNSLCLSRNWSLSGKAHPLHTESLFIMGIKEGGNRNWFYSQFSIHLWVRHSQKSTLEYISEYIMQFFDG